MKKILITGASGFIGSFLVEEALNRNFETYAGIRSTSSREYLKNTKIKFFEAELSDKETLKQKIQELMPFDYIIHNAGLTKTCKNMEFDIVNFQYTRNLCEAIIATNKIPTKFIYISSIDAYGPGNEKTMMPIKMTDKANPITFYGKSKLKTEKYLSGLKNLPHLIIRPTGVYGPREKDYYVVYKSIKNGLETYIGTKKQAVSFIYVKDLAKIIFDALESNITNRAYFVSDLKNYTTEDFNKLIKKELNKKTIKIVLPKNIVKLLAYISGKISCLFGKQATLNSEKFKIISAKNWLCNSSELIKDFGFKPKYNLEKGINETITWYKKNKLI